MEDTLLEFVDSRGTAMRVDRGKGIIRGVKILGADSRNGRRYPSSTLSAAAPLYEGVKVNVDHPAGGPHAPREYRDRIGVIRGVSARADEGLFADFHFNPKHALAEQLMWDAEHTPENVGFSHNVRARTSAQDDRVTVEEILAVNSVDLVADPATTRGLFESMSGAEEPTSESPSVSRWLAELTVEQLEAQRPDLTRAVREELERTRVELTAEVERLREAERTRGRRETADGLLRRHGLPGLDARDAFSRSIVSEGFVASLLAAPDEEAMRTLIAERAKLVRSLAPRGGPVARDQNTVRLRAPADMSAFVEAITY